MAASGVVMMNLNLQPGHCVEVKGFIPPDSKWFSINLGKNASTILIHFNARFDHQGDIQKIVCNSLEENAWGTEQREDFFPFQQGSETTVCFEYQADKINIKLPSGEEFAFPVRMELPDVSFLSLAGIQFKSITYE
ncbi:galectin-1-like isoform X2 [Ranitomeya imitator]|uniref:galectin-1-like isoform X2 n=1 Tax=Ranitomeya imitator TaxID=111125 RepID=UPI0037E7866B